MSADPNDQRHELSDLEALAWRNQYILDNTLDGFCIFTTDGFITHPNHNFAALLGYSIEELRGKHISLLEAVENPEQIKVRIQNLRQQTYARFETRFRHKDGKEIPIEVSSNYCIHDDKEFLFAFFRDQSERFKVQKQLFESEEKYRTLVEVSPFALAIFQDEKAVFANAAMAKLLRPTNPHEIIGRHVLFPVPESEKERLMEIVYGHLNGNPSAPTQFNATFIRSDNSEFPAQVTIARAIYKGKPSVQLMVIDVSERDGMLKVLQKSQEAYRDLVENINDVIYTIDNKGIFTYTGPSIERVLQYTPAEVIGKPFIEFTHPDDIEKALFKFKNVLENKISPTEFRLISKDGNIRWVRTYSRQSVKNNAVIGIQGVLIDITEQRRVEDALRVSEKRFRGLFDHYLNGYALCEIVTDNNGELADIIILETNKAMEEIDFIDTQSIIGKSVFTIFPVSLNSPAFEMVRELMRTGKPIHREIESQAFGRWLDISLYSTGENQIAAIFADISLRKKAEAALRESEERYRAIWENSPMGICLTDRDGIYHFVNKAYCEIYGYSEDELIGYSFFDKIMDPGHPRADKGVYPVKFDKPQPVPISETNFFVKKNGEPVWIEYSSDFIYRDGQAEFMVTMNIDITQIRKAQTQLAESEGKYGLLIENAAELIMNFNSSGILTLMNRSAARQIGGIPEDFVGKSILEIFPRETAEAYGREISRVIQTGKAISGEMQWVLQDEKKWFSSSIQPLFGADKQIMGAMVIATDISEQKITVAHQEARLNFLRRLRNAASIDDCLKFGCQAIFEAGLFRRSVMTLHNEKREIIHLGQVGMNEQLVSATRAAAAPSMEISRKITQEKFRISHSYFIPAEAAILVPPEIRYIRQEETNSGKPGAWVLGDELFIPIIGPEDMVEGWLSVDTPFDGKRPRLEAIHYLEEIVDICSKQYRQFQSLDDLKDERRALEEKNIALREILAQIKEDKDEIRQKIASIVSQVLLPALNKLVKKDNTVNETYYNILKSSLPELITVSGAFVEAYARLSPREREIYSMIKGGLTSKEIAEKLHIALSTVQKHREIIRRKLGIRGQKIILSQHLSKL